MNAELGFSAQDFETTVAPYLTEVHLRGLLNYSALCNQVTYVYDTAIADNPHLINSFHKPGSLLYRTFEEFVKEGVIKCLFRNRFSIRDEDDSINPTTSDLYGGYIKLYGGPSPNFVTQMFGRERERYNEYTDNLLFHRCVSFAVNAYDIDQPKRRFRELIRSRLKSRGPLPYFISQLPPEIRYSYEKICAENEYFATADLRAVLEGVNLGDVADFLITIQGYTNQEALADAVSAGLTGADGGRNPWRPHLFEWTLDQQKYEASISDDELRERSVISLTMPTHELLGLLPPDEVMELRQLAQRTIWNVKVSEKASPVLIDKIVNSAIESYWTQVCAHLNKKYPEYATQKRTAFVFVEENFPKLGYYLGKLERRLAYGTDAIGVLVDFNAGGGGNLATRTLRWASRRLYYRPSEGFQSLAVHQPAIWKPHATWSDAPANLRQGIGQ